MGNAEEKPIPKKRTGSFSIKPTAPPIPKKQSSVGQGNGNSSSNDCVE